MAKEVQSGYVPGRAFSPEAYGSGFVDFYKDYLGTTGIQSTVPVDDNEEDDAKKNVYQAPNILGSQNSDDGETNLLSSVFSGNSSGGGGTYYDSNVEAVDIQSMDLTSKSWDDYKSLNNLSDKTKFSTRDAQITGFGTSVAGLAGGAIGGALFGEPIQTPWGVSNQGSGMFKVIGDYTDSLKYEASIEHQAAKNAFGIDSTFGDGKSTGDIGAAITIDGQYLVRRPGNMNFIGTLPTGITNQKAHNLVAINQKLLPNYLGGAGVDEGFGITGLGGYNADGRFVTANGDIAQYGPAAARDALAAEKFGGNTPEGRRQADLFLADLRNRGMFESGVRTYKDAKRMLDLASGAITPVVRPELGGYPNPSVSNIYNPPEEDPNYNPNVPRPLDDAYNTYSGANIGFNMGRSGFPSGSSTTPVGRQNLRTGEEEDPNYNPNVPSPLDDNYNTYSGANIGFNTRGTSFNTKAGTQYIGSGVPSAGRSFKSSGKSSRSVISQSPTSLFNSMKSRGFTNKQATDVLNTLIPDVQPTRSNFPSVTPASFTQPSSDDNNESPPTDTRDDTTNPVGLDAFGGAGEPVDNSGGGSSSDDKIVCTAMNNAYGFGSFRQTIWLKHSHNLDPAYQIGYHKLFRPLIKYAYTEDSLPNKIVKKWLEGVAKRRTADIWLQSRNKKRPTFGRIERALLEPICYIAGKI